ncbi:Retrotransposon protein [Nesidiocoris tenuis]|uniref:Retrotransposon protein n=1 Tax=Nesidiocoris tenuis TaxID=355587 RepID=A0ABN7AVF6_9HEMI|nr:Retrotransposon protein [Nesidiocoris tenuis]
MSSASAFVRPARIHTEQAPERIGHQADSIYADIGKAFDKLQISFCSSKLRYLNFSCFILVTPKPVRPSGWLWLAGVLETLEVPRGSVVGPTRFLAFIDDSLEVVRHSKLLLENFKIIWGC